MGGIAFIIGMFAMFLVFSLFFVMAMYGYKDGRLRNAPDYFTVDSKPTTGTQMILRWDGYIYWLMLPISTLGLYYFLKKKVITK